MNTAVALKADPSQPIAASEGTLLGLIAKAASDPAVDIDKMDRLLQMHERMKAQQAEQSFNAALNRAQSRAGRVEPNQKNNQTNSRYADYAALDRVLRPVYTSEGFSLSFDTAPEPLEGCIRVLCHVSHIDGHSRTYQADMPVDGKGAKGNDVMTKTHATGSGMSYGMRYLLKMIFNVAIGETDDDGNGAGSEVENAEWRRLQCIDAAWRHRKAVDNIQDEIGKFDVSGDTKHLYTVAEAWGEIPEVDQMALWLAPTKGGVLTTHEREVIKTQLPRLEPAGGEA